METDAEVAAGRLQALERQGLQEATRSGERGLEQIPLEPPEGANPAITLILDF